MSEGIIRKDSGYVIGIDLGTTNTAAAVYKAGNSQLIKLDGEKTLPSVMSVLSNGDILVGNTARNRILIDPENTVSSIKRQMGKEWSKEFTGLPDKQYTSVDVSAEILSKVISSIQQNETIDLKGNPKYAVICIPANFDDSQKKATKKAGELAGLNVMKLLEEPVAAAYYYALERERDQTILVYDLGGGTFDVSILQVDSKSEINKNFKILSKEGIQELGGDDFDLKMMQEVGRQFEESSGIDIFNLEKDQGIKAAALMEAQQKLKETIMRAKHDLTEMEKTHVEIPNIIKDESGSLHSVDIEITRDQFNEQIRDMILQTKDAVQKALEGAKLTINDVDRIILVGGSTKVPIVKEILKEMFNKEPYSDTDPDAAIACGAAILGATLNLPQDGSVEEKDKEDEADFIIDKIDKVTHYLGIEIMGGKFNCLIEKDREIPKEGPATATKEYTTPRDNMTELTIGIYQSPEEVDYVSSDNCKFISEFFLTGIPPKPRGEEVIKVYFEIDDQNLLKVKASSSGSSKELEISER